MFKRTTHDTQCCWVDGLPARGDAKKEIEILIVGSTACLPEVMTRSKRSNHVLDRTLDPILRTPSPSSSTRHCIREDALPIPSKHRSTEHGVAPPPPAGPLPTPVRTPLGRGGDRVLRRLAVGLVALVARARDATRGLPLSHRRTPIATTRAASSHPARARHSPPPTATPLARAPLPPSLANSRRRARRL